MSSPEPPSSVPLVPAQRVGITGGGGFIGRALAARLTAEGHEVRGFDLDGRAHDAYDALGAQLVVGDICDPAAARSFCAGLDTVIHTAAIVEESGSWQAFERINIGGTATMVDAARRAGVRTFIHFSSVMVYGFDYPEQVTEAGPLDGAGNPYCTTKITSEQVALLAQEPGTFDVFVIRPGDVYGPGSVPWLLRPVEQLQRSAFAFIDARTSVLNHVYIDNLIDGVELVWAHGTPGDAYCITDGRRTLSKEFFGHLQRFCGVEKVPSIPGRVALRAATLLGGQARRLGIDRETVRYLRRRHVYSIAKVTALGYRPAIDLDEGMQRCHTWLLAEGLVPGPRRSAAA